jgi:hypothetical protein
MPLLFKFKPTLNYALERISNFQSELPLFFSGGLNKDLINPSRNQSMVDRAIIEKLTLTADVNFRRLKIRTIKMPKLETLTCQTPFTSFCSANRGLFAPSTLSRLIRGAPNLAEINFIASEVDEDYIPLILPSNLSLDKLAKLNLSYSAISGNVLGQFLNRSPALEMLDLNYCSITRKEDLRLSAELNNLREIIVGHISNSVLQQILQRAPNAKPIKPKLQI